MTRRLDGVTVTPKAQLVGQRQMDNGRVRQHRIEVGHGHRNPVAGRAFIAALAVFGFLLVVRGGAPLPLVIGLAVFAALAANGRYQVMRQMKRRGFSWVGAWQRAKRSQEARDAALRMVESPDLV